MDQGHRSLPELSGPRGGNAGVADERHQLVSLVCGLRLGSGDIEVVEVQWQRIAPAAGAQAGVEHASRAAVVPLLDRANLPAADDTDQARVVEHVDVVGHGALGPADRHGHLRHGGCSLVQQPEERRSQRVADGPNLGRGRELHGVVELVVGHVLLAGHRQSDYHLRMFHIYGPIRRRAG